MSEPNDQMGSVTNPPWAGLWVHEPPEDGFEVADPLGFMSVGAIVVLQPDATVSLFTYQDEADMQNAWADMEMTLEIKKPQPGDAVIFQEMIPTPYLGREDDFIPGGWRIKCEGNGFGYFQTQEEAVEFTKVRLPNVDRVWLFTNGDYLLLETS